MTIEERLIKDLGTTSRPELAVWMTKDGTLVNGSHDGIRRDVDHHEISHYYKKSKYDDGGSSTLYIRKFMRRGNIRMGCHEAAYIMELACYKVTKEQLTQIKNIMENAPHGRDHVIGIYNSKTHETTWIDYECYIERIEHYPEIFT